jgi:hypothetical protein
MVAITLAAIPAILALECLSIPWILAVAFQALAVLAASAGGVILTPWGLGFADLTVC